MLEVDAEQAVYKGAKLDAYYQPLLARIAEIPGVHSASGALITPISGGGITNGVQVEGYTPQPDEDKEVYVNRVAPKYFETLGTPLLAGRDFTLQDQKSAPKVAMINQTMARYYFRNANPIGRHVITERSTMEIIGVVGDAPCARGPLALFTYPASRKISPWGRIGRVWFPYWTNSQGSVTTSCGHIAC